MQRFELNMYILSKHKMIHSPILHVVNDDTPSQTSTKHLKKWGHFLILDTGYYIFSL